MRFHLLLFTKSVPVLDNSGKVWLIRTRRNFLHVKKKKIKRKKPVFSSFFFFFFTTLLLLLLELDFFTKSSFATWVTIRTPFDHFCGLAEQTCEEFTCKQVIQASTASSHRVGKCIIEPSKQSRIRKSSFWSRRRSTVRWETALSSKERSRRVNCPMLVPYNTFFFVLYLY